MNRISLALLSLAFGAVPALAQDLPFDSISSGSSGAFGIPAGNYVAKSGQELDAAGLTKLIPPGAQIDWANEMVIAVVMGARMTGGFGISVTGVKHRQLGFPSPGSPPPWEITVDVLSLSPLPGEMVTKAPTAPYHMIKLARSDDLVNFNYVPTSLAFDSFSRAIGSGGWGIDRSISIDASGAVEIHTSGPGFSPVTIERGQAPFGGVERLQRALALAKFRSVPDDLGIPVGTSMPTDVAYHTYIWKQGPLEHRASGWRPNASDAIKARLDLIDRELEEIMTHVLQNPAAEEFKGTVAVNGSRVSLEGPQNSVEVADPALARLVRNWVGETVKLEGELTLDGQGQGEIKNAKVLYPRPLKQQLAFVQLDASGEAEVILGFGATANTSPTSGRAARAMALGAGRTVQFDGYAFLDANDQATNVYVESVQGRVLRWSWQTRRGVIQGFLRRDDLVTINHLTRSGRYAHTDDGETTGYVHVNRLEIGAHFAGPLMTGPATGPGFAGSLPGSGN